ncbi:MAG TPA: helix-turn-helix domain-containing protein [Candidatus Binatia bacterium]|jgi:DNA-binding XRE family transcriptional regulator
MILRNRLNRFLHDRGLAEGEVALVARLDQGHLNRIKNGRVKPTLVTALRIAHALGASVNQLFYLEGLDDDDTVTPARPLTAGASRAERRIGPGPERALPPAAERARSSVAAGSRR